MNLPIRKGRIFKNIFCSFVDFYYCNAFQLNKIIIITQLKVNFLFKSEATFLQAATQHRSRLS